MEKSIPIIQKAMSCLKRKKREKERRRKIPSLIVSKRTES